jgi:hypothetical protein
MNDGYIVLERGWLLLPLQKTQKTQKSVSAAKGFFMKMLKCLL